MFFRTIKRNMSQSNYIKLLKMAEAAESRILDLKNQVNSRSIYDVKAVALTFGEYETISICKKQLIDSGVTLRKSNQYMSQEQYEEVENLKKVKVEAKIKELSEENKILASKVDNAKLELIKLETNNGKTQYALPSKSAGIVQEKMWIQNNVSTVDSKTEKKEKNAAIKSYNKPTNQTTDIVDVRKLDFRIGKVIDINKHPDADSLYVEKIDCGEEKPRTVVSGLVNHVPIDEMRDRTVMVLCNLKPVKMRGITSEAMVMCASSQEKVEVLIPPSEALPGDLVSCEGYPREPEVLLNPKKKIFETCAPDLQTNNEKVACYKGNPLVVQGKGPIVALTLKGVNVK